MKRYTIEVNEHQLQLIANCIEDCSRFLSGQTEMWHTVSQLPNYHELTEKLKSVQKLVAPDLETGASYGWSGGGCENEIQSKLIAETYYLYRTMLYAIHKNDESWSVYTNPSLRCADSGEPIIVKEVK